jgi:hypothetical protein
MVHLKYFPLFLLIFISTLTLASEKFYEHLNLGELSHEDFSGPIYPNFKKLSFLEPNVPMDKIYFDNYFVNEGSEAFFNLQKFIEETLPSEYICPNQSLGENIEYAHYLFRLIHLSFLYESLSLNSQLIWQLEGSDPYCAPSWERLFSSCRPQGDEMSKFLVRSKEYLKKNPFSFKGLTEHIKSADVMLTLFSPSNSYQRYFSQEYEAQCAAKNCAQGTKEFLQILKSSCQEKYKIIENICSERDDYGSLSEEPKMTELIYLSNASVVINQGGYGRGCLDRFSKLSKRFEKSENYISKSFAEIARIIQEEKRPYLQGDLFLPGALKQFDDKGLVGFLFVPSKPTDLDILTSPSIPGLKLETYNVQIAGSAQSVKKGNNEASVKMKSSYFDSQVERRKSLAVKSLEIDMEQFDADFIFKEDLVKNLSQSLAKFQTQRAIQDMKVHDKIGSLERPLSLLYLKFLLNTAEHQSIFNLTYIVGNDFYIENDIDRKKEAVLISLKNDYRNRFGWQIYILAP